MDPTEEQERMLREAAAELGRTARKPPAGVSEGDMRAGTIIAK